MQFLRHLLLAFVACCALAGAPAMAASQPPTLAIDKAKLLALANQVAQVIRTGATSTPATANATGTPPKVLVLYDAPSGTAYDKLSFAYAIMLRNLLGHFDATVDLLPVQQYAAGSVNNYDATFYLGGSYDFQLPAAFLADAVASTKPLVWFKYNLWQLAWNASYNFTAVRGIQFNDLVGLNAAPSSGNPNPGFYDTVTYKGLNFVKYYQYDAARNVVNADPDLGSVTVTDATKASVVVPIANSANGTQLPYVVRSGNFWYVADMPFSFIGPRDRYLVFTDLLHDMLGIQHAESHKALVRLEDVGAMVSVQSMKTLSDYLANRKIPFSVAVIPRYEDPLGVYNGGVAQEVLLSQAKNLQTAVNYARGKGGELVMHGFTHQYDKMRNPNTGVSGDDFEFWNIVDNTPVQEDSVAWAYGRMNNGLTDMRAQGWSPIAWEPPHYQASAIASRTSTQLFSVTYMRAVYYTADQPNFFAATAKDFSVGQFYPFPVGRDWYGARVIPENLGNIEYDISTIDPTSNYNYTPDDIITNAQYAKVVRDGYASWFFHPFWLEPDLGTPGFQDFQKTMDGITALGYSWVAPSTVR
jgi:uncharacterized protein YdaL